MIYVATVHVGSARWIGVQRSFLTRNIAEPFKVYANLQGVEDGHADAFDRVVPAGGHHAGKLNLLAAEICATADPDDLIVFLDGDAFPIADPMPVVRAALETTSLVAVRRDENATDRQPHPSFCAVTAREWERLRGDWSAGYTWEDSQGRPVTDVGGNLLASLERTHSPWTPLLRTNRVNLHPLWFGVYGDVVYHHGAGFRWAVGRVDLQQVTARRTPGRGLPAIGRIVRRYDQARAQRAKASTAARAGRIRDDMLARIERDPDFYRELI